MRSSGQLVAYKYCLLEFALKNYLYHVCKGLHSSGCPCSMIDVHFISDVWFLTIVCVYIYVCVCMYVEKVSSCFDTWSLSPFIFNCTSWRATCFIAVYLWVAIGLSDLFYDQGFFCAVLSSSFRLEEFSGALWDV